MKTSLRLFVPLTGFLLLSTLSIFAAAVDRSPPVDLKYDFSAGPGKDGFTKVAPAAMYADDTGFGYEQGTQVATGDNGNVTTSTRPFLFSAKVPEGNYNVTVTLGDSANATTTTIKAESGRLMAEKVATTPGQIASITFTTNVRTAKLPPVPTNAPGGDIVRTDQFDSGNSRDWDDKLTIEINSAQAALRTIEISKVNDAPTIFLAGDSTMTDRDSGSTISWGQMLPRFFKAGVAVSNHAQSGETLKTFMNALRLDKILSQMKRGDYLIMQFGHNDEKQSWPQSYVQPATTWKAYLKVYIAEARLRGATPILVTPMERIKFNGAGQVPPSHGDYPEAMREVAKEENVALIDLTALSKTFYEAVGSANSRQLSADGTHHTVYGAYELAKCIVMGIKQNKLDLAKYITDDFVDFDAAHPDPLDKFDLTSSFTNGGNRGGQGGRRGANAAGAAPTSTSAAGAPATGNPRPGPL